MGGRVLDYEKAMNKTKGEAEEECLPYVSFADVIRDHSRWSEKKNLLMSPITDFFSETQKIMRPLKQIVVRTRRQLISDVGDQLFGEEVRQHIQEQDILDLQYLGLLLLIPKVLQLLTLILGWLSMTYATHCSMEIISSIEPRRLVTFFGRMCMFSFVYCICTQLDLYCTPWESYGEGAYRNLLFYCRGVLTVLKLIHPRRGKRNDFDHTFS